MITTKLSTDWSFYWLYNWLEITPTIMRYICCGRTKRNTCYKLNGLQTCISLYVQLVAIRVNKFQNYLYHISFHTDYHYSHLQLLPKIIVVFCIPFQKGSFRNNWLIYLLANDLDTYFFKLIGKIQVKFHLMEKIRLLLKIWLIRQSLKVISQIWLQIVVASLRQMYLCSLYFLAR